VNAMAMCMCVLIESVVGEIVLGACVCVCMCAYVCTDICRYVGRTIATH